MTLPVLLDARILTYNDTGIARYVRHLYRAMRVIADEAIASGGSPPVEVTVLESRRERRHHLSDAWPDARRAWTPPHHRLERWTLAGEVGLAAWTLARRDRKRLVLHSPDHVSPGRFGILQGRRWANVVTVHDLAFMKVPDSHTPESRAYYSGIIRTARDAEIIICPSKATATDLLDETRCDPSRVRVIPEAADPRYRPASPGAPMAAVPGRPYILTVGSIEPRKNVKTLLEAIATLPPSRRPMVRIVGAAGRASDDLGALVASKGLDRDVAFMGRMGTEEIGALYRGAIAAAYLSLYEGFGLPVLEAMACGCPVIASGVSSIPEVAGDAALLVDPGEPEAVAHAIETVMGDAGAAAELRRRGLARAARFTWATAARQTIDAFRDAAG